MGQFLIATNQVRAHGIQLLDDLYDQNRLLGIVDQYYDWYIPFTVQPYFAVIKTRAPPIKEYTDCPNIIYMTSDNRWDPLDIQISHHSLVIGALKCSHPEKHTDNSEYDVLTGIISIIYTARLAEFLSDEAAKFSEITTMECHSKVDARTLEQRWSIGLRPTQ